ncbi:hypothetical protein [Sphingobium sp. WCS2017Hpa-17]|nr:hypothetical protein [Sphingobium sp. WCS2017Hpa-17]
MMLHDEIKKAMQHIVTFKSGRRIAKLASIMTTVAPDRVDDHAGQIHVEH